MLNERARLPEIGRAEKNIPQRAHKAATILPSQLSGLI